MQLSVIKGDLPFKAIIHVAEINMLWVVTEQTIRLSVRNALHLADSQNYRSIVIALVGADFKSG